MDLEQLHSKLNGYDLLIKEAENYWKEIHSLKPKEMKDLDFQELLQQTRLNNKLIESFLNNEPLKCKNLIYKGADKQYLYTYVSKMDSKKLSISQGWLLEDLHNTRREKHYPYVFDSNISDIRTITKEEYNRLLNKFENKEEFTKDEQDCFFFQCSDSNYFIAVDNSSGNMWTEEFKEKSFAERYLRGESIDDLKTEECKYEVRIYENKDDYNRGEPFQLNVFSDLEEAKEELKRTIKSNNYFSGNILNQNNGNEEYSYYSQSESEKYKYIILCNLKSNSKEYENQFLLVRSLDTLDTNLEIDLTGNFCFNCDYKVQFPILIKTINTLQELVDFCKEREINIPKDCIRENGLVIGGKNGLFINKELEAIGWIEELGELEELGEQE